MSFAVLVIASADDESVQDCRCRRKCQFAAGANFSLSPASLDLPGRRRRQKAF